MGKVEIAEVQLREIPLQPTELLCLKC